MRKREIQIEPVGTSDGVFGDDLPEETTFEQIKITKHSWSHKTHGDLEKSLSCREVSTISEKQKPVQYQNLKAKAKKNVGNLESPWYFLPCVYCNHKNVKEYFP